MLLQAVRDHLKATRMSPTRFGREAVGDPKFVFDLENGRRPRKRTVRRVMAYLAAERAAAEASRAPADGRRGFEPARYVRRGIVVAGRRLTFASHESRSTDLPGGAAMPKSRLGRV